MNTFIIFLTLNKKKITELLKYIKSNESIMANGISIYKKVFFFF